MHSSFVNTFEQNVLPAAAWDEVDERESPKRQQLAQEVKLGH